MNIYQRINEVRKEVKYIKKDAEVQGYTAVSHDAVTAAIRDSLIEHGIVVNPTLVKGDTKPTGTTTAKGVPFIRYEGEYDIQYINVEKPEDMAVMRVTAHAVDQGDKAPGKCVSYATKQSMLKMFSLESGDADESREDMKAGSEEKHRMEVTRAIELGKAIERNKESITAIKNGIATKRYDIGAEAWFELDDEEKKLIWVAPSKGGPFSTEERSIMQTTEWREAYYGPDVTKETKE